MAPSSSPGAGGYPEPGGTAGGTGVPTTNLNMQPQLPNQPGMGQMVNEGQTSMGDMQPPQGVTTGNPSTGAPEAANKGIETASSPSHSTDPGSPGHELSQGLSLSDSLGTPDASGAPGTGAIPGNPDVDTANRPTGNPNQS